MAASSSMTTTSSATSRMIFSGCSTSSSSSSTTTGGLLPFSTTIVSKCRAFHFHHRLLHVHVGPYKNPRIHFTHSTHSSHSPSSFVAAAMATEASAKVIDGKKVAKEIRGEIAAEVSRMKEAIGVVPGLAVILVGDRKDSTTYVRNKKKACEDHINEQNVLNAVCIEKDVDGFHPLNIGHLAMRGREPFFVPCTPKGCIELLHSYGVIIKGKRAVVIGRSNIVGMPAALLLQRKDATVSVVHSRTKNPEKFIREADIIIAAVGKANMVKGSWIKPGAVIIDVGINPVEDAKSPRGYQLVGDMCCDEASQIASAITPVPGGVGPMTIAMLLSNTLTSAKRIHSLK